MKQHFLILIFTFLALATTGQKITVITLDNFTIDVDLISDSTKRTLLQEFKGKQNNTIRKQWTARTYRLSDDRILLEFYDGQAAIVKNKDAFDKLKEVRFTKNYIDFLKKNITYKIEISFEKGLELAKLAKRITNLKPEMP